VPVPRTVENKTPLLNVRPRTTPFVCIQQNPQQIEVMGFLAKGSFTADELNWTPVHELQPISFVTLLRATSNASCKCNWVDQFSSVQFSSSAVNKPLRCMSTNCFQSSLNYWATSHALQHCIDAAYYCIHRTFRGLWVCVLGTPVSPEKYGLTDWDNRQCGIVWPHRTTC